MTPILLGESNRREHQTMPVHYLSPAFTLYTPGFPTVFVIQSTIHYSRYAFSRSPCLKKFGVTKCKGVKGGRGLHFAKKQPIVVMELLLYLQLFYFNVLYECMKYCMKERDY
jgi:hypothetical protein